MNLLLAINTASQESAIALIDVDEKTVLAEDQWESKANESQKVLPTILSLLDRVGKGWSDLATVFVVKGPGSYTSLRVGVTIANSIAWKLGIPMRTADVFEVWESRIDNPNESHVVAIAAGRDKYLLKGEVEPRTLAELKELGNVCYGEVPDDFEGKREVGKSFGEGLVLMEWGGREQVKMVEPLYVRPPHITTPKSGK